MLIESPLERVTGLDKEFVAMSVPELSDDVAKKTFLTGPYPASVALNVKSETVALYTPSTSSIVK